jgi:hypothetical protein
MSKRAVLIITEGLYVDGVTLRTGDDHTENPDDVVEHLSLRTSEQLLADLRTLAGYTTQPKDNGRQYTFGEVLDAAARVRALLPEETQDE